MESVHSKSGTSRCFKTTTRTRNIPAGCLPKTAWSYQLRFIGFALSTSSRAAKQSYDMQKLLEYFRVQFQASTFSSLRISAYIATRLVHHNALINGLDKSSAAFKYSALQNHLHDILGLLGQLVGMRHLLARDVSEHPQQLRVQPARSLVPWRQVHNEAHSAHARVLMH